MKKEKKTAKKIRQNYMSYVLLLIRLILAAVLLILAFALDIPNVSSVCILVAAAMIAGMSTVLSAVEAILKKNLFSTSFIIILAAGAVFCSGCYKEAVLFIIFYEIGVAALEYASKRTLESISDFTEANNEADLKAVRAAVNDPESNGSSIKNKALPYFEMFTKAAFLIGILFAALIPLISDMTYIMSVRRGAMLIAAAASTAAIMSLGLCSSYGIGLAAAYGIHVKNSYTFEKTSKIKTVVYDKTDVFSEGIPKISSVSSPVLDNDSFLKLAAYIAYRSEQRIAAPIVSAYGGEIKINAIDSFTDIPGCGMEIIASGRSMYLGTRELLEARGVEIPETELRHGFILYMVVGNNFAGSLSFKENISPYAEAVVSDFAKIGGINNVLITEDGRDVSEKLALNLNIDDLFYECDTSKKIQVLNEIKETMSDSEAMMYVSAESLSCHTPADIDAKVGFASDNSDILMSNIGLFALPVVYSAAKRSVQITKENLIAAIAVKLLLVILALTGSATMWFVILLDYAVSIGCVLNVTRIPSPPLDIRWKQA